MKRVYFFGKGKAEGDASQRNHLGGKGANLAEMTNLGVPVPPGFTITTACCKEYYEQGETFPSALKEDVLQILQRIESAVEFTFGSKERPLLVSVRSGARVSMPGMMDTILNLGLNDETVLGLVELSKDERFAFDSYRRLIQMYGDVVLEIPGEKFSGLLEKAKAQHGVKFDTDLTAEHLRNLTEQFKTLVQEETGKPFPQDPRDQLWGSIAAVFRSWNSKRANKYRRIEGIPGDWGTAVNVQAMVFGNMGDDCATGVAFTRDPSTGEKRFFGEFLVNAQGEDVVAGIRTPRPINRTTSEGNRETLEDVFPKAYAELVEIYGNLERHYRDMQDIEFTIQQGKLWLLQTRNGKRTARAALTIACDMVKEKLITPKEAVKRVLPAQLDQMLHPFFDHREKKKANRLAAGLPASPGAAVGKVYFSADHVQAASEKGEGTILVRTETSPEDIHGMNAAEGILTARGGMTSHAAVVARGMGRTCVAGCQALEIDEENQTAKFVTSRQTVEISVGDVISLDGSTGEVFLGEVATRPAEVTPEFEQVMKWSDEFRRLKVRTNADTPEDARKARELGAQGIGLCRTEHMFFGEDRIAVFRQMILADDEAARREALKKILPFQKEDFKSIFREMKDLPVTIRLLDPPLHEFLPQGEKEIRHLAADLHLSSDKVWAKVRELKENNPMLGHRGCRLGISYPEIYETQVRAIMEAATELVREEKFSIVPEIMVPLVATEKELAILRNLAVSVSDEIIRKAGVTMCYRVGTMIEIPRAAITADKVAQHADFFSFGTNDLTQMTLGISRDDSNRFLPLYLTENIMEEDPFVSLDVTGVGELIRLAVEKGRKVKPDLSVAICGEHGGDPRSVLFCHRVGLDYVSCSPYRVPVARLAAAHAALEDPS